VLNAGTVAPSVRMYVLISANRAIGPRSRLFLKTPCDGRADDDGERSRRGTYHDATVAMPSPSFNTMSAITTDMDPKTARCRSHGEAEMA
jgi:hypothetical protein